MVSRICEEFQCLPSHAVHELEEGDTELLFTILDLRAYARTKDHVDSTHPGNLKMTPAIERVLRIDMELKMEVDE